MKRFSRCISLLLAMVLLLAAPAAYAAEAENQRASDYFMRTSAYLHGITGTGFDVWFEVTAVGIMDKLGVNYIRVEKSTDAVNWETARTYYMSNNSQMTNDNALSYANCVHFGNREAGYYYRAYVQFYAEKGNGSGYYACYTSYI